MMWDDSLKLLQNISNEILFTLLHRVTVAMQVISRVRWRWWWNSGKLETATLKSRTVLRRARVCMMIFSFRYTYTHIDTASRATSSCSDMHRRETLYTMFGMCSGSGKCVCVWWQSKSSETWQQLELRQRLCELIAILIYYKAKVSAMSGDNFGGAAQRNFPRSPRSTYTQVQHYMRSSTWKFISYTRFVCSSSVSLSLFPCAHRVFAFLYERCRTSGIDALDWNVDEKMKRIAKTKKLNEIKTKRKIKCKERISGSGAEFSMFRAHTHITHARHIVKPEAP